MKDRKTLDKRYEAIAWGAGFIWVGILGIIPGEQNSIGVLSIGLILLGLNLARYLSMIPINVFSTLIGVLTAVLGLVAVLLPVLNIPRFEVEIFPLVLIVIGLYFLVPGSKRAENG